MKYSPALTMMLKYKHVGQHSVRHQPQNEKKANRRRGGKEQKLCECGTSELPSVTSKGTSQPMKKRKTRALSFFIIFPLRSPAPSLCLSALLDSEASDETRRCKDVFFD